MKKALFIFIIISLFPFFIFCKNAKIENIEKKEAVETFRRMFESAHPTPDPNFFPQIMKVPLLKSSTILPIFLNVNTIVNEASESFKMQNESSIAVNPINPLNLIASAVDYRSESSTWVYVSDDGGKTWINHNLGKPYTNWRSTNDPSVYFNSEGIGYLCYGGFGKIDENQVQLVGENGVFIAKTTDQGKTWKAHIPVIIHLGDQTLDSTFEDKYYVQVDNSKKSPYFKHLYNPWKRVTPRDSATQIVISKSIDDGETWSIPIPVSPRKTGTSEDTTYGQSFPLTTTGPNGEVYVVWNDGIEHGVGFAKSLDGGKTYTSPKIIKKYNIFGKTKYIPGQGGYRHTVKDRVRCEAYPVIQCDITGGSRDGYLYLTWAADSIPNVYFSRSLDKGETWSDPIIVHSTTKNDQFWQWLAVDPTNGDLAIMYLDSRDDDENLLVDCYVSYSSDGGITWIDRRAGDESHDLRLNPFLDNAFAGDYSGCAFYNGMVYPSWVDMRNAISNIRNSDVYTAVINTRAPLPVENFSVKVLPEETSKLRLTWTNPATLSFGQPLDAKKYKLKLLRDGFLIATLDGGTEEYSDENLNEYQTYNYQIYTVVNNDSSIARLASGNPGGSKNPLQPTIIASEGFENEGKYGFDLQIKLPSLRADSVTALVDLSEVSLYLDDEFVDKFSVTSLDTGKTINYKFDISKSQYEKGYYKVSSTVSTSKSYSSNHSNYQLKYSGKPIEISDDYSFTENFDTKTPRKYYYGSKWNRTSEFAMSTPSSLTESPNSKYENNKKDTFLLFPVRLTQKTYLNFYNAAIIDQGDSALVEFSLDNGNTWSNQFTNKQAKYLKTDYSFWNDGALDERDWMLEQLEFPSQVADVMIRLRFNSNNFRNDIGWFLDNLTISTKPLNIKDKESTIINIYPSIASNYVKLHLRAMNFTDSKLVIYSVIGNKIFERQISNNEEIINVSEFEQGLYFFVVEQKENIIYKNKFIVMRKYD